MTNTTMRYGYALVLADESARAIGTAQTPATGTGPATNSQLDPNLVFADCLQPNRSDADGRQRPTPRRQLRDRTDQPRPRTATGTGPATNSQLDSHLSVADCLQPKRNAADGAARTGTAQASWQATVTGTDLATNSSLGPRLAVADCLKQGRNEAEGPAPTGTMQASRQATATGTGPATNSPVGPHLTVADCLKPAHCRAGGPALRLARYFGTSDGFWMNLQNRYDLEIERERLANDLRQFMPFSAA